MEWCLLSNRNDFALQFAGHYNQSLIMMNLLWSKHCARDVLLIIISSCIECQSSFNMQLSYREYSRASLWCHHWHTIYSVWIFAVSAVGGGKASKAVLHTRAGSFARVHRASVQSIHDVGDLGSECDIYFHLFVTGIVLFGCFVVHALSTSVLDDAVFHTCSL